MKKPSHKITHICKPHKPSHIQKNSFYLFDTHNALLEKYNYDFTTEEERSEISFLIKMCFAKHEFGSKKPGLHEIAKIKLTKPKNTDEPGRREC